MVGNPTSSGTGFLTLSALTQLFGEDEAIALMKRACIAMSLNTRTAVAAASKTWCVAKPPWPLVSCTMRLLPGNVVRKSNSCCRVKERRQIGSLSLVAGGGNAKEAEAFYEWALGTDAQSLARKASAFQASSNRGVLPDPRLPEVPPERLRCLRPSSLRFVRCRNVLTPGSMKSMCRATNEAARMNGSPVTMATIIRWMAAAGG